MAEAIADLLYNTHMKSSNPTKTLTLRQIALSSVLRSWRVSLSVACGVAVATAVIVGALLVGDSMRGSLRALTVERLGKTDSAIFPSAFFESDGITDSDSQPIAVIFFDRGIAETKSDGGRIRRASSIQIIGIDDDFWTLDANTKLKVPTLDQQSIALNASAANELGVTVGDSVTLRLPVEQAVPADSPLGRRDTESEGIPQLTVGAIIPDRGLGRFSLRASQAAPMNIYVARSLIAAVLDRPGQANGLLFDSQIKDSSLRLGLDDFGLQLKRVTQTFANGDEEETIFDYYSLTSDRLLLADAAVVALRAAFDPNQMIEVSTYLANAIERLDQNGKVLASVPYSTITAIDSSQSLPLDYGVENKPDPDAVPLVLNSWAADQLQAEPGTSLRVAFYEPEVEKGVEIERTFSAIVTSVVPITEPATPFRRDDPPAYDQRPTLYNDTALTPIVPGVTDQESINDWDLPFQLKREISSADDEYWNNYRLTPKAFLPAKEGQVLFGSRFGSTTGIRFTKDVAPDIASLEKQIVDALRPIQSELGWSIQSIRQSQLAASRGTTPFDGLFLSLSFFVILAAVLLIAMLFRLGLIARTKQFGSLMAVGWPPNRILRLALGEGLLLACAGVVLGAALGVAYAWLVLWALRSWWVGAVTVPFLTFHWTYRSLFVGAIVGWVVAALTLFVASRWVTRRNAVSLLTGNDPDSIDASTSVGSTASRTNPPKLAIAIGLVGVAIALFGATQSGQAAAGAFVGGGTILLVSTLMLVNHWLGHHHVTKRDNSDRTFSVGTMAAKNASRHPLRSTMTIGLMASAAFLIIAISAFRLQPSNAGTGGFTLVGQTAQPVLRDLADPQFQRETLGSQAELLSNTTVVPIRLRLGQDASCNNLYQATQPTVLGLPESFGENFSPDRLAGFELVGSKDQVWKQLNEPAQGTEVDPIPVVIDQNTAMWSLQMLQGVGEVKSFEYEPGYPLWFRVVGMLSNSMLQGKLLIGETNFEQQFPDVNGYRYFLFSDSPDHSSVVAELLEDRMGDFGMDVTPTDQLLGNLMAVQNTYLRTFQSLGGLGLLLGTIGLAISQLRSVLERQQELAVMRAIGFTRQRLAAVVLSETVALLLLGVGCGALCASVVVIPHALISGLQPPLLEPLAFVVAIIAFGFLAGLLVVRQVVRMPLLASLRAD